ncbi:PEP-CTERM sorting domain-containing protein, partial [Thermoleptolyngbya sp.]
PTPTPTPPPEPVPEPSAVLGLLAVLGVGYRLQKGRSR